MEEEVPAICWQQATQYCTNFNNLAVITFPYVTIQSLLPGQVVQHHPILRARPVLAPIYKPHGCSVMVLVFSTESAGRMFSAPMHTNTDLTLAMAFGSFMSQRELSHAYH